AVEAVALRAVWRLVGTLGFTPRLDACARDAQPLASRGPVTFSVADGGLLCPDCARAAGAEAKRIQAEDCRDLAALTAEDGEIQDLDARHAAAHRRLLGRWIRHHVGGNRAFPALDWWEQRPWAAAS
ncbi:MAG: DNA repair protein RecO, partial [Gemmatimonadales bacterium]